MMEPTIQFAGDPQRSRSVRGIGGVVPLRQSSRTRKSTHRDALTDKLSDDELEDEDAGLRDERDYKQRQVRTLKFPHCTACVISQAQSHPRPISCMHRPRTDAMPVLLRPPNAPASVPVRRRDLRGHWHVAAVRVFIYVFGGAVARGSHGRVEFDHLELDVDGDGQVYFGNSEGG